MDRLRGGAMTAAKMRIQVSPWDDPLFLAAFERARSGVEAGGMTLDDPRGQLQLQFALRGDGYPDAVVVCERTVAEALDHTARCVVRRDG
jgi:hypothetical protein